MEKKSIFNKLCQSNGYMWREKTKQNTDLNLTFYTNVNSKWIIGIHEKWNIINLVEDRKKSSGSKDRKVFLEITNA